MAPNARWNRRALDRNDLEGGGVITLPGPVMDARIPSATHGTSNQRGDSPNLNCSYEQPNTKNSKSWEKHVSVCTTPTGARNFGDENKNR